MSKYMNELLLVTTVNFKLRQYILFIQLFCHFPINFESYLHQKPIVEILVIINPGRSIKSKPPLIIIS